MYMMTMVDSHVEQGGEDEEPRRVIDRKRCQFIDSDDQMALIMERIRAHDTAGEMWKVFDLQIDDDGIPTLTDQVLP